MVIATVKICSLIRITPLECGHSVMIILNVLLWGVVILTQWEQLLFQGVCVRVRACVYVHVYDYVWYACMCVCVYDCVCVCVCVCVCLCLSVCMCMCVHDTCSYTHTCAHTHMYTHIGVRL